MCTLVPFAIYEVLSQELRHVINRVVTFPHEKVPLHVKRRASEVQLDKFLTKLIPDESSELDRIAYDTFKKYNANCSSWSLSLNSEAERMLFGEFAKVLEDFFLCDLGDDVSITWGNIALNARCGPGAAIGAQSNSHYGKLYSGPLTATDPEIVSLYRADIAMWPEESNAEIIRQEEYGSPTIVKGSRSSFVPKSVKTSRMISVEPTLNMYYQLGFGRILEKRLKRFFGIDLSVQPSINRYMAYIGSSIDSSFGDGFATIDLSSASDSLSLKLASHVIPDEVLSLILALRSHGTSVRIGREVVNERLNMISTMGNGFTFPLQTVIFACAASAVVGLDDGIRQTPKGYSLRYPGLFSVFGDDIVVPARCYDRMLSFLRLLGCDPNEEKSFGSGSFRESCGHDYYDGHNIRPVFLRKLKTDTDLLVLANLLVAWGARLEIDVSDTVALCLNHVNGLNFVPMSEAEDSGLKVPYVIAREHSRLGEVATSRSTQSWVYTKRHAHQKQMRISDGDIHVPVGAKRHIYNPPGLMISYLLGEIRGGSIGLTVNKPIYRTKRAVTPNWDYSIPQLEDQLIGSESPAVLTKRTADILDRALQHVTKKPGRWRKPKFRFRRSR